MEGQPEEKATQKLKKILPIIAVSHCIILFTQWIPSCLPDLEHRKTVNIYSGENK